MSSARALDGLFYSAVVVTEADSDSRFYHTVSRKLAAKDEIHFVNADNKQTAQRVRQPYVKIGVKSAVILDIDILSDASELAAHLDVAEINATEKTRVLTIQSQIQSHVEKQPLHNQLLDAQSIAREMSDKIQLVLDTKDAENMSQSGCMRWLRGRSHDVLASTKAWRNLKREGITALPTELQTMAWELLDLCSKYGIFINPLGELESMLSEYGIKPSTDKRSWIVQALQLLLGLTPDNNKHPWKFVTDIHGYLFAPQEKLY